MKARFSKRIAAFIIDTIILSFIYGIVTMGITSDNSNINNELNDTIKQYEEGEININEYNDKVIELNYKLQKSNLIINILEVVLYVGYFVIFGFLNKGQTLGKKLCKIKVVNREKNNPNIWNMLIRSMFIYELITLLYSIIFVNILDKQIFTYGYLIVNYSEIIFIIVSFFMVIYKKDGKGLHDIIAKTYVIEEVK